MLAWPATTPHLALLVLLLVADFAFMAGYVAFAFAEHYGIQDSLFYGNPKFSFIDGGYPETYGYGKQALIALLLFGTFAATRQALHGALALLFTVTLLDDSLMLHETLGLYLSEEVGVPSRIREVVAFALIGLAPLFVVFASYRFSDECSRADARAVLLGFALLLFFAVGMDVIHGIVRWFVSGFETLLTLAEDGGELLTMTLISAMTLGIFRRRNGP